MIELEMKIEGPPVVFINAYAPHEDRVIEEKEDFYKNSRKGAPKSLGKKNSFV